jgi:hypothetical protein
LTKREEKHTRRRFTAINFQVIAEKGVDTSERKMSETRALVE